MKHCYIDYKNIKVGFISLLNCCLHSKQTLTQIFVYYHEKLGFLKREIMSVAKNKKKSIYIRSKFLNNGSRDEGQTGGGGG